MKNLVLQNAYKKFELIFEFVLKIVNPLVPTNLCGFFIKATAFLFGLTVETAMSLCCK